MINMWGTVDFKLFNQNGDLLESGFKRNTIVDTGKTLITQRMFLTDDDINYPKAPAFIALGTSNQAGSASMSTLVQPVLVDAISNTSSVSLPYDTVPTLNFTNTTGATSVFGASGITKLGFVHGEEVWFTRASGTDLPGLSSNSSTKYYVAPVLPGATAVQLYTDRTSAYIGGSTGLVTTAGPFTAGQNALRLTSWPYTVPSSNTSVDVIGATGVAITYKASITNNTGAIYSIGEAGIFNENPILSPSSSIMLCRTTFGPVTMGLNDVLAITWTINFADSNTSS